MCRCGDCRNLERRPMYYKDYCPVLDAYVNEDNTIYDLCCDCYEEDI